MADDGKDTLLKIAADVGKYYAFIGQSLRSVYDREASAQLPSELLDAQIAQIRTALAPALEKNHVVKENFERVDQDVARIRRAAVDGAQRDAAIEEAKRYAVGIQERAKVVSDLVALFRRL